MKFAVSTLLFVSIAVLAGCISQQSTQKVQQDPILRSINSSYVSISANHIYGNSDAISKIDLQEIISIISAMPISAKDVFYIYVKDKNHVEIESRHHPNSVEGPSFSFYRSGRDWIKSKKESSWII